jgi:hypothetical protein
VEEAAWWAVAPVVTTSAATPAAKAKTALRVKPVLTEDSPVLQRHFVWILVDDFDDHVLAGVVRQFSASLVVG